MINGSADEFVDRISTCQDTIFLYKGRKYWFQGYMSNENTVHMEIFQIDPAAEDCIWEYNGSSIKEGQKAFQTAPIFDGKTFWEVEQEMEWVDC